MTTPLQALQQLTGGSNAPTFVLTAVPNLSKVVITRQDGEYRSQGFYACPDNYMNRQQLGKALAYAQFYNFDVVVHAGVRFIQATETRKYTGFCVWQADGFTHVADMIAQFSAPDLFTSTNEFVGWSRGKEVKWEAGLDMAYDRHNKELLEQMETIEQGGDVKWKKQPIDRASLRAAHIMAVYLGMSNQKGIVFSSEYMDERKELQIVDALTRSFRKTLWVLEGGNWDNYPKGVDSDELDSAH
jgi:hypothetical protein